MAISKVRAKLNGTWTNLAKNASTGKWSASLTAPAATSYNQAGGYYPITIEVTNDAGTVKFYETTDSGFGTVLKLVVQEKTKPVITLVSPSAGEHVANNKQPVTFKVTDETGGSGVKLSEVNLKIDSATIAYNDTGMSYTAIANGYQFVYTPQSALSDGSHTITINAKDNDGNSATAISFTIEYSIPRFVYDRTQEDVDRVMSLHQKGWKKLSADERKEWMSGTMKGTLNRSDLKRIENNIYVIAQMIEISVTTNRENLPYIPDDVYFGRMLLNVELLRKTGFVYLETPQVPGQPINTYQKVNAVERILHDVYTVFTDNYVDKYYCGQELYADGQGLI